MLYSFIKRTSHVLKYSSGNLFWIITVQRTCVLFDHWWHLIIFSWAFYVVHHSNVINTVGIWVFSIDLFSGYYRVQYDEQNWRLIIATLRDPQQYRSIHVLNRAQLLDDAMNLARAGLLDYHIALNVTSYLQHESELVPWRSALNALAFIEAQMYRKPDFEHYKVKELVVLWAVDTNNLITHESWLSVCSTPAEGRL